MKQKWVALFLAVCMLFSLAACSDGEEPIREDAEQEEEIETVESTTTTEAPEPTETQPAPTEPPRLSDSCDRVLCTGYEGSDFYELVATETEDYAGVKVKIGIIKNNQWEMPLTSDMPFIGENGALLGGKGLEDVKEYSFYYLGRHCFFYRDGIIYNVKLDKSYKAEKVSYDMYSYDGMKIFTTIDKIGEETQYVYTQLNSDAVITSVKNYSDHDEVELLNLNTLEEMEPICIKRGRPGAEYMFFAMSENVFVTASWPLNNVAGDMAAYDIYGKELFSSSHFKIPRSYPYHYDQHIVFQNGKCTFYTENNNGTIYKVTIDTTGKVLEQEEQTDTY